MRKEMRRSEKNNNICEFIFILNGGQGRARARGTWTWTVVTGSLSLSPFPVRFSKSASTPFSILFLFLASFVRPSTFSLLSSFLSLLVTPQWLLVSLSAPSDPTPDNANWSQSFAPRPSCLTPPHPLVISLIVHLTPPSRLFVPLCHLPLPPLIYSLYWPHAVTIVLQQLSLAGSDSTSLPIPQAQDSFSPRQPLSFNKTTGLQSNWRSYVLPSSLQPRPPPPELSHPPPIHHRNHSTFSIPRLHILSFFSFNVI